MQNVNAANKLGHASPVAINRKPDKCPICHRAVTPLDAGAVIYLIGTDAIEYTFRCPADECQHVFVGRYAKVQINNQLYFELRSCVPSEFADHECSEIIKGVSVDYCAIYNQAHKAEQYGLNLVIGPGYRKALEFLVKDYLLKLHPAPEDQKKIKETQLGNCIKEYVKNENVSKTAERAAWLGNDETHFVRKWEDKDVRDLKTLIGLTVRWIEMEQMTKEVVDGMPAGKK